MTVRTFRSPAAPPRERGEAFGAAHAEQVRRTWERYARFFAIHGAPADVTPLGAEALEAIRGFAPDAAEEIEGLADGAGLPHAAVAALNARTEVLARLGIEVRGECSTVVVLGRDGRPPVCVQTWDWHDLFADGWLLWTIEHPDGRVVHTVTEHGILGKIGVSSAGVGVHLNILHHERDGRRIGVPVHVVARTVLDRARDVGEAVALAASADVSASSVLTIIGADGAGQAAICAELLPGGPRFVAPDERGVLLHTNHFLDVHAAAGDRERVIGPDSWVRLDVLRRALAALPLEGVDRDAVVAAMRSHVGGAGAVCCHPAPDAELGDRWETLVTVALDPAAGTLTARPGGPCNDDAAWRAPAGAVARSA